MNNSISSPCSIGTNAHTYKLFEDLQVSITETDNPFGLPVACLFSMAARVNKKRSFLFVSKLLGKHIPVNPYTSLLSGAALALLIQKRLFPQFGETSEALLEQVLSGLRTPDQAKEAYLFLAAHKPRLPEPLLCIGFAETATALGHSVFNTFAGGASYMHTTREHIPQRSSLINFDEEHSHAVSHRCYALDPAFFSGGETVVLVDDEMTTGKTALNIIRDIQSKFPRKQYVIASLLDWRNADNEQQVRQLRQELDIDIQSVHLLKGLMGVAGSPQLEAGNALALTSNRTAAELVVLHHAEAAEQIKAVSVSSGGECNSAPYLKHTGRFGMQSAELEAADAGIHLLADWLKAYRGGSRALVMGTGEFMYMPMRIAAGMGEGISYQSTTRSPIYAANLPEYAVTSGYRYPSPEDEAVSHFIYNVTPGQYDEIFVLFERDMPPARVKPMLDILKQLAGKKVFAVFLTENVHGWETFDR
ncbi:phosphoribosyltransferase family protein [Paenibacillus nasutitermitis]|uniref:TRSP domain C terminus to PRTase_2 n=1 Tax=Paenibacillus nasutitermitis TaxID=1652958 RepID=A0A916ZC87_9BACL|nr:phosphoribosyltransferase family protein [Paenibacillus nasutitermitis]GGD87174.1 hypothetical protein GCM10010911_52010 [Paenibacillus nasutitermitis]